MSEDKKISAKELFKDYVPEVLEYDAAVDAQYPKQNQKIKTNKKKNVEVQSTSLYKSTYTEEFLKNYVPEVLEYDEEIDGSDEFKVRETMLNVKENLLEKIRKAKAARKNNQTTFRQNIRTENEK
jgi:hypothetical protein